MNLTANPLHWFKSQSSGVKLHWTWQGDDEFIFLYSFQWKAITKKMCFLFGSVKFIWYSFGLRFIFIKDLNQFKSVYAHIVLWWQIGLCRWSKSNLNVMGLLSSHHLQFEQTTFNRQTGKLFWRCLWSFLNVQISNSKCSIKFTDPLNTNSACICHSKILNSDERNTPHCKEKVDW